MSEPDQTPEIESLTFLRDRWRTQDRERKAKIVAIIFQLNELSLHLDDLAYDLDSPSYSITADKLRKIQTTLTDCLI